MMLMIATLLFILAALLGILLLSYILQNKETRKGIAFTHGPIAALGLVILIIYSLMSDPAPWLSVVLLALAAGGGFVLIYRDLTGKTIPKWFAIGHGSLAVIGFISLVIFEIYHY